MRQHQPQRFAARQLSWYRYAAAGLSDTVARRQLLANFHNCDSRSKLNPLRFRVFAKPSQLALGELARFDFHQLNRFGQSAFAA